MPCLAHCNCWVVWHTAIGGGVGQQRLACTNPNFNAVGKRTGGVNAEIDR